MIKPILKPILQEIIKPMLANVALQVKWVAKTDGATQYWFLSKQIVVPKDSECKITLVANPDIINTEWIPVVSGSNFSLNLTKSGPSAGFIRMILDGRGLWGSAWEAGQEASMGLERTTTNSLRTFYNDLYSSSSTYDVDILIDEIGRRPVSSFTFAGYIKSIEIEIDGVITNQISLTNKAQGATQLATVGNVNATMANYNNTVWVKESEL